MNSMARCLLAATAMTLGGQAAAQQITFFEREGYDGRSVTTEAPISNLKGAVLASSAVVSGEWEVCDEPAFGGRCVVMLPGEYPTLRGLGLSDSISSAKPTDVNASVPPSGPQITFYGQPGFKGRSVVSNRPISSLEPAGRGSSVIVLGGQWEVCDGVRFSGRCIVLRPGSYPSFGVIGLDGAIASARPMS